MGPVAGLLEEARIPVSGSNPVDVAWAALCEVGRHDLAMLVCFHLHPDGGMYLEPLDEVTGADLELMVRAEQLALDATGQGRR